ncbi:MAG: hypothetical protein ACTSVI_01480 [Promethearchaeota archaeon]
MPASARGELAGCTCEKLCKTHANNEGRDPMNPPLLMSKYSLVFMMLNDHFLG